MSQDTEEKDGKGVADIDISPHEETNLLKRIRAGELTVPPSMMGFGFISENDAPKSPLTSSQGALSLQEIRERSAARQAKEAKENTENKEARELKYFLKLGEKIHKEKCPPNPFLSGNGLGALTTSLGKSVSNDPEDIWSAICCLESYYSNILSLQFQFELPRGKQKPVYYSSRNLSKALTELKRSLKALSAFKERQLSGDDTSSPAKAEKEEQINFVLKGRPHSDCFRLVGLPRSQDKTLHVVRWEKTNLLPAHCNNAYLSRKTFQQNFSGILNHELLKRIIQGSAICYESHLYQEGGTAMDTLLGITVLLSYSSVLKLREKNVHTTTDLLRLSSRQFKNFKFDPRTVRAIVEKMLHAGYFFSDGRTATEEILSQPPQTCKSLTEVPAPAAPAPPGSAAADPASAVSAAADPPADNPNSFEAILGKYGSILDQLPEEENPSTQFSFARKIKGPDGRTYRFKLEEMRPLPSEG